jgi:hypothetical protein
MIKFTQLFATAIKAIIRCTQVAFSQKNLRITNYFTTQYNSQICVYRAEPYWLLKTLYRFFNQFNLFKSFSLYNNFTKKGAVNTVQALQYHI